MSEKPKFAIFQPYSTASSTKKNLGLGLGDRIERIVKPIARSLKMKCLDEQQQKLRAESPCAKRRDKLNQLGKIVGIGKTS